MKKALPIIIILLILFIGGGVFLIKKGLSAATKPVPTPTPTTAAAQQLTPDQIPAVSLKFSADAHYVTVNITNIHAAQVEYNIIYDATVKGNTINTGVNASSKLDGKTEYSKQQLLGSESSGHFTYHTNIKNAVMELTLRDAAGRSVFTSTYPFTVSAGSSLTLTASL